MAIQSGTHLGPYEILSAIGAGGMGEVYRARDSKLGRDVAIKVLPEAFARDADRMARFQREAKVLASLDHPNIATIHGLEESGGMRALVMQLVEGPTLADRIKQGPIPIDEAIGIARQVADALEYAHERGIVHRDLKPANVKVTADDAVKVLDFGLAKALEGDIASLDISTSPTISRMATMQGVLLGTAAYMSPEQAKGKAVDRRADIWAFGCVLYEMLTGKVAFQGEAVTDTLAAVIKEEPDWSQLPAATPVRVRVLMQRCLQKDPKQRLRDIGDARISLDEVLAGAPELSEASAQTARHSQLWVAWGVAVTAGILAFSIGWFAAMHRQKPSPPGMVTFTIEPPAGKIFAGAGVSPDGKRVAMVARTNPMDAQLLIRSMDNLNVRTISGTEGLSADFVWSPDSQKIAFVQGGQIKSVDLATGIVQTLCSADKPILSDWGANGIVLFNEVGPSGSVQIFQVAATGGSATPILPLDSGRQETLQASGQFLPDGKRFLYHSYAQRDSGVYAASLGSTERKLIRAEGTASDLSVRDPNTGKSYLMSCIFSSGCQFQQFDVNALQLIGNPHPVPQIPTGWLDVGVEGSGLTVVERAVQRFKLAWYSRDGKELEVVAGPDSFYSHELSPDDRKVSWEILTKTEPNNFGEIWTQDLMRGSKQRLTSGPGWEYTQRFWPDGSKIAFMWYRDNPMRFHIAIKPTNGLGSEDLAFESQRRLFLDDISPDGAFLLYSQDGPPDTLWVLPLRDRRPTLIRASTGSSYDGRFSADGRWIAYTSTDSGPEEIQVLDFVPEAAATQRPTGELTVVSTGGGNNPRWSKDGKELFYLAPDATLMAVPVNTAGHFTAGKPEKLFTLPANTGHRYRIPYAVSADARRFLIAVPEGGEAPDHLVVVTNWIQSVTGNQ